MYSRLKEIFTSAPSLHVWAALISSVIFGYFIALALPVAMTAIASGRGITLSVFEVGSDKVCEQAPATIAIAANNNEVALYNSVIDRLIAAGNQASSADPNRAKEMGAYLKETLDHQRSLSLARTHALNVIAKRCFQPENTEGMFSGRVIGFWIAIMVMLFLSLFLSTAFISGALRSKN